MMLDKKGQALIEFVLILPILIMLLFAVIDFGNVFVNQNELETALGLLNDLEKTNINYNDIYNLVNGNRSKKINVNILNQENGYVTVVLQREIDIITPGANIILDDPYIVKVQRVIKYE